MTRRLRRPAALFLAALSLSLGGCGPTAATPKSRPEPTRTPGTVPAVTLWSLENQRVQLSDVVRGRVVVIDLWATWCVACREVSKRADELARAYPDGEVLVLGVDQGEEREIVAAFLEGRAPPHPILLDPTLRLSDALGVTEVPTVIVVDREGRMRLRSRRIDAELVALVDQLAREASPARP